MFRTTTRYTDNNFQIVYNKLSNVGVNAGNRKHIIGRMTRDLPPQYYAKSVIRKDHAHFPVRFSLSYLSARDEKMFPRVDELARGIENANNPRYYIMTESRKNPDISISFIDGDYSHAELFNRGHNHIVLYRDSGIGVMSDEDCAEFRDYYDRTHKTNRDCRDDCVDRIANNNTNMFNKVSLAHHSEFLCIFNDNFMRIVDKDSLAQGFINYKMNNSFNIAEYFYTSARDINPSLNYSVLVFVNTMGQKNNKLIGLRGNMDDPLDDDD